MVAAPSPSLRQRLLYSPLGISGGIPPWDPSSGRLSLGPDPGNRQGALIYHLAVPKLYLLHHGFYFIPGNVFAGYPLLGEMHYLLAFFLQNDILAKAMNYAVLCGILLGMGLFTRFLLREHGFPCPQHADLPLDTLRLRRFPCGLQRPLRHLFHAGGHLFFPPLVRTRSRIAWLILCGIFSGSAAACKYTALLLTPLGCLGILWFAFRRKTEALRALRLLALYVAAAFIAGSPFYLKNWIVTGNPFYPFFYGYFGGRGWDADQARLYDLFIQNLGMGRALLDYLLLPWNLSFRAKMDSPQFDGILGPIFLLTLPFLAGLRRWETPVRVIIVYACSPFSSGPPPPSRSVI